MDIKEILQSKAKVIDEKLLSSIPETDPPDLAKLMREYPSRPGKRLRPVLLMLACEAFGGKQEDALISAVGLEMFQDWVLIHDDIEDDSESRRGKPALHLQYGMPLSLNAGDALHVVMWYSLIQNREIIGDDKTFAVMSEFAKMIKETTEGQHLEIDFVERGEFNLKDEDYFKIVHKKTSWYTTIAPFRIGALIAGDTNIDRLNEFADHFGKAFQLQDDILDLTSTTEKFGKVVLGDLYEGKRTLILIHLINNASAEHKEEVLQIMRKTRQEKSQQEVERVLELMKQYGSIDYAIEAAEKHAAKAKEGFLALGLPETKAKEELLALIDYVVKREL